MTATPDPKDRLEEIARGVAVGTLDRAKAVAAVNEIVATLPGADHPAFAAAADAIVGPALAAAGFEGLLWEKGDPAPCRFPRYTDRRDPNAERLDLEANWFAAGLLMPETAFREIWEEMNGDLVRVASLFGVNPRVAQARAQSLGLAPTGRPR